MAEPSGTPPRSPRDGSYDSDAALPVRTARWPLCVVHRQGERNVRQDTPSNGRPSGAAGKRHGDPSRAPVRRRLQPRAGARQPRQRPGVGASGVKLEQAAALAINPEVQREFSGYGCSVLQSKVANHQQQPSSLMAFCFSVVRSCSFCRILSGERLNPTICAAIVSNMGPCGLVCVPASEYALSGGRYVRAKSLAASCRQHRRRSCQGAQRANDARGPERLDDGRGFRRRRRLWEAKPQPMNHSDPRHIKTAG